MAGRIKELIDELITVRTEGSPSAAAFVRAHLMMKGINPDRFDENSADDPHKIAMLQEMIEHFSIGT